MVYLTGGLAVAKTTHTFTIPTDPDDTFDLSKTKVGWTVGFGLEYMIASNWTFKTEALYVDLGKSSLTFTDLFDGSCFIDVSCRFESRDTMWVGRLGLNYKFGGPIVAKY